MGHSPLSIRSGSSAAGDFPEVLRRPETGLEEVPGEVELRTTLLRAGTNRQPAQWPEGPDAYYEYLIDKGGEVECSLKAFYSRPWLLDRPAI